MWIDTHAHVSCMQNPEAVAERAHAAGVEWIINICTDIETLEKGVALREACPYVCNVASTTPHDVDTQGAAEWGLFSAAARRGDLVAIGETGLDFYYERAPRTTQQEFLARYAALACEVELPLVIHCRSAFEAFYEIMRSDYFGKPGALPGILHCFTGTLKEAAPALDEGWAVSLSGILTFKKSEVLQSVARDVPFDRIVIETDAPWLAPQSRRGKTNEPAYVVEVGEMLAHIRGVEPREAARITTANAKRIFRL